MKHQNPQNKVVSLGDLQSLSNKKIVFTNGCFDILHAGHIEYLYQAAQLGDVLLIGLNSDNSVRRIKGETRPINKEIDRAIILASLYFVDYVMFFDEDTPLNLIEKIKPNVLVKGGDYSIENIVGADFVQKNGGKVIVIPFKEGYSSSSIISKI